MKIFKATGRTYVYQLISIVITFIGFFPFLSTAENKPILFSTITAIIYFLFMYSAGWNIGSKDGRKIPGFYPDKKNPLLISLFSSLIPLCLLLIRLIKPDLWSSELPFLCGKVPFIIGNFYASNTPDFLFRLWYLPLAAFVPNGNIFAYILLFFVPPVFIFIGYLVGIRRFSISEFLYIKLVFADNPSKKKDRKFNR